MVKIYFYEEIKEVENIPERYNDFLELLESLYGIDKDETYYLEYTIDNANYYLLNINNYYDFFLGKKQDSSIHIFLALEETTYFQNKEKKNNNDLPQRGSNKRKCNSKHCKSG